MPRTRETVLDVGAVVDVLGVIDVSRELAPSGKLVTFVFGEDIQTADYAAFAPVRSDEVLATRPVRARNVGDRAELCTTLYVRRSQRVPDLSNVDLKKLLKVERDGTLVTDYSLSLPRNHDSDYRSHTDFCIGGLAFSSNYRVTIRKGLSFAANRWPPLSNDIAFYGRTRDRDSRILLDSARYILPVGERSLLPVTTVNVNEVNVEVFRIDPRTLVSVRDLFANLDGYDSRMFRNVYAESLGQWSTTVASDLNESRSFNLDLGRIVQRRDPGLFVAVFSSPELAQSTYENRPTQWFAHSDIGITTYSGVEETLVALVDFKTLDPIARAAVQVLGGNNRELFAATSDGAGTVRIPQSYLAGSGGNAPHMMIVTTERGDFSVLEVANLKSKPRFLEAGRDKAYSQDIYLTVQRELFRVGDDVEFAVIVRDLQLEPLADFNLDVAFIDPRGSEVGTQSIITNEHGVAAGSFGVQPTDLLGPYEIRAARRDGIVLASGKVTVDDFVPLTIDVAVSVGDEPWSAAGEHDFAIAAGYLSGGPARGLAGDFRTEVRAVRSHTADGLDGFVFGPVQDPDYRFTTEVREFALDDAGEFTGSVSLDAARAMPPGMYELRILAAVRDVGGRPNTATVTVPLATHPSYVGVRSEFGERLRDGATAAFSVARIDRLGVRLPNVELPYRIVRVRHSYDWYYDEGWRWRRTRQADETVASGAVGGGKIIVSSPLDWGSYELEVEDATGFRTVLPFRVGWGSDGRPALEPEQLALSVAAVGDDAGVLRASLPFAGILRIQIAHADVISEEVVRVSGGDVEIPLELPDHLEPGFHVLATLLRPVRTGSEHLPQIALGSAWIPSLAPERDVGLRVDAPDTIRSTDRIPVTLETQAQTGSAVLYLVDEGIHALTGFRNADPKDFFYGERDLPLGFVSNHGRLIRQDHALQTYRAGGGDESAGSGVALKSKFFKTVAVASPILPIRNGRVIHEFDQSGFEGRLRLVALVASDQGLGFQEYRIEVRDPVSLDVSLPRFIGTGDELATRVALRANDTAAHVRLEERIGETVSETRFAIAAGNSVRSRIGLTAPVAGFLQVEITASFDALRVSRRFALRARLPSYPHTELRSLALSPAGWFRAGRTDAPALTLPVFDLAGQTDLEYRVTLSATPGVALNQIFAALDRYPYGCLEQVSSATRGLVFRQQLKSDRSGSTRDHINHGIDRIIANQQASGAFGYWDRFDNVWEQFQPYAVETLMLALPHAEDRGRVTDAIGSGLEYLYRRTMNDVGSKLYAYGVLARAGYEVTSRARYAMDHELFTGLGETVRDVHRKLDRISLAYWLADILNDERRMRRLHGTLDELLADRPPMEEVLQSRKGWAESTALFAADGKHLLYIAPNSAHFLAQVSPANRTPLIAALVQETGAYLSALPYRSTYVNSRLAQMVLANTTSLAGAKVEIDGRDYRIAEDGSVDPTPRLHRSGFKVRHQLRQPLYLNVEVTGPRATRQPVDNGFKIEKSWYDSAGERIEIDATPLHAEQGDLFTVVLEIVPTRTGLAGESVLTDLLPSGFELEAGAVAAPRSARGGVVEPIDIEAGKRPEFVQHMDDRFVAHFAGKWVLNERSVVAYTVRAVYPGTMVIPDAHLELLYQPYVNGRSRVWGARIVADPSWADQGIEGCADTAEPCAAIVARFMKTFGNGDKAELADSIVFPIPRPYPIPPIEHDEFLDRYHEVFDETLTRAILSSTLSNWVPVFQTNHRSTVEWLGSPLSQDSGPVVARSIQLGSDQGAFMQLEYSGKVSFIYHRSEFEKAEIDRLLELRDTLISEERLRLHIKLREFESPVLEWETDTYRIRVDYLGSDTYRYSAWKVDAPRSDRPDLVLDNGKIIGHHDTLLCGHECGRGEGVVYGFVNEEYLYEVDAGYCYCHGPPEERSFNLRVWRSPGRTATVPALEGGHGFFFPRENGYRLVLHEPFENTSNRLDLALYADYRARNTAIRGQ